jgi:hypothetical protein
LLVDANDHADAVLQVGVGHALADAEVPAAAGTSVSSFVAGDPEAGSRTIPANDRLTWRLVCVSSTVTRLSFIETTSPVAA